MNTWAVTLEVTDDELQDLRVALFERVNKLQADVAGGVIRGDERYRADQSVRNLRIVLQALRMAEHRAHDGGPVGTARYTVR